MDRIVRYQVESVRPYIYLPSLLVSARALPLLRTKGSQLCYVGCTEAQEGIESIPQVIRGVVALAGPHILVVTGHKRVIFVPHNAHSLQAALFSISQVAHHLDYRPIFVATRGGPCLLLSATLE